MILEFWMDSEHPFPPDHKALLFGHLRTCFDGLDGYYLWLLLLLLVMLVWRRWWKALWMGGMRSFQEDVLLLLLWLEVAK